MAKPIISIIVPVYNERSNILPTTESILSAFDQYESRIEILFVDDDSPDDTANEVTKVSKSFPEVRLVQHGIKEGIGAAHRAGYESATADLIMCIDADLSQSASDLINMKKKIDEGYDLVVGSRYMPGGEQVGKSLLRDWGSRSMNLIAHFLLGIPLTDATQTFRAFKKELFEKIAPKIDQKGHPGFQIQFSYWVVQKGYKVQEIPIKFVERSPERGKSKLSIRKELPSFIILVLRLLGNRIWKKLNNN